MSEKHDANNGEQPSNATPTDATEPLNEKNEQAGENEQPPIDSVVQGFAKDAGFSDKQLRELQAFL